MHVVLHVYPVTRDLGTALIVCEAAVAAELRDDRIQIEEALTIYNLGRTAWQPDDVRMALPEGFTAFNAQATMSDQGVDEVGRRRQAPRDVSARPARDRVSLAAPVVGREGRRLRRRSPAPRGHRSRDDARERRTSSSRPTDFPDARGPARRAGAELSGDRAATAARRREALVALDRHPRPPYAGPRAPRRDARSRPARSGVGLVIAGCGTQADGQARLRDAKRHPRRAARGARGPRARAHLAGRWAPHVRARSPRAPRGPRLHARQA